MGSPQEVLPDSITRWQEVLGVGEWCRMSPLLSEALQPCKGLRGTNRRGRD